MKIKLICIQRNFTHWANYSGYHQYLRYLPDTFDVDLIKVSPGRSQKSNGPISVILSKILFRQRTTSVTTWNDTVAEMNLVSTVKSNLLRYPKIIVHFLDGEHVFNHFPLLMKLNMISRKRVKIAVTYHQPPKILKDLLRPAANFSGVDKIFLVAANQREFFQKDSPPLCFIHHGVATSFFKPLPENIPRDEFICITVGQWLRDFDTLNHVIRMSPPEFRFRIIGISESVKRFSGENPQIEVLSGISDKALLHKYQTSTVGLMPLMDCTANNSILEMMASGLPVISTDVGGIRDYVDPNGTLLVQPNNANALFNALLELHAHRYRLIEMGRVCREQSLAFDWPVIASRMSTAYTDML